MAVYNRMYLQFAFFSFIISDDIFEIYKKAVDVF